MNAFPNALLMLKLVWDCFHVECPAHENVFVSFPPAAVDYLAKNVSLSTQRRMKLGDHSAVLGLLQVETGQAYWVRSLQTHLHTLTDAQTPPPTSWSSSVHPPARVWEAFTLILKTRNSCHSVWRDLLVILGLSCTSNSDKRTMQRLQARQRTQERIPSHFQNVLSPHCA